MKQGHEEIQDPRMKKLKGPGQTEQNYFVNFFFLCVELDTYADAFLPKLCPGISHKESVTCPILPHGNR